MKEFAYGGLHGTSTEKIAARAGISQPPLPPFRHEEGALHRELRSAASRVLAAFQEAAEGKTGYEARKRWQAYDQLLADREMLLGQQM